MQEEVTRKTTPLRSRLRSLTGNCCKPLLRFLQIYRKERYPHWGQQTLKQLMRHGTGVSSIEITDANIKAFSQTAKKYGVDFALKKADDRYLVFFKGRDADVLTAAFREFSKKKLDKERKPSVRMDLTEKKAEAVKRTAQRAKVKNKDRGIEL
ncbi:MAG: PcfB family protein [[Clostridium] leptum]